jgi:hypothetical protein
MKKHVLNDTYNWAAGLRRLIAFRHHEHGGGIENQTGA